MAEYNIGDAFIFKPAFMQDMAETYVKLCEMNSEDLYHKFQVREPEEIMRAYCLNDIQDGIKSLNMRSELLKRMSTIGAEIYHTMDHRFGVVIGVDYDGIDSNDFHIRVLYSDGRVRRLRSDAITQGYVQLTDVIYPDIKNMIENLEYKTEFLREELSNDK